jgi:transcription-repair coupling factor (superfamily II helicase)
MSTRPAPTSLADALAQSGQVVLEHLPDLGLSYLVARDLGSPPLLVVCADEAAAGAFLQDLEALTGEAVHLLLGDAHTPFEAIAPDPRAAFSRFVLRQRLVAKAAPRIIVATAAALQGRWLDDETFAAACMSLQVGQDVDRDALARNLVLCGYQPVSLVEDEGTFAVRGGVVDIYVPGEARPLRLDLFGDELASIKAFAPDTQRTFGGRDGITVFPIREVLFDDASVARAQAWVRQWGDTSAIPTRKLRAMADEIAGRNYFFGVEALWPAFYGGSTDVLTSLLQLCPTVVVEASDACTALWAARYAQASKERQRAIDNHSPQVQVDDHLLPPKAIVERLATRPQVHSVRLVLDDATGPAPWRPALADFAQLTTEMQARRQDAGRGEILDPLVALLKQRVERNEEVFLVCGSRGHAERLRELLLARRWDLPLWDSLPPARTWGAEAEPRRAVVVAQLRCGIDDRSRRVALLTDFELFGTARTVNTHLARPSRKRPGHPSRPRHRSLSGPQASLSQRCRR